MKIKNIPICICFICGLCLNATPFEMKVVPTETYFSINGTFAQVFKPETNIEHARMKREIEEACAEYERLLIGDEDVLIRTSLRADPLDWRFAYSQPGGFQLFPSPWHPFMAGNVPWIVET